MSLRTSSSPGARRARRRGVGRSDDDNGVLERRRPEAEKTGRQSRLRRPRADSFSGEVEDDEAVLVVAFDLNGEVLNGVATRRRSS